MARPTNPGLDYFPLDTDIDQDDKIALVESDFGIEGFGIIIKLLMKIYANSYFYKWGEKERKLFVRRVNVDINYLSEVVNACIRWGVFNKQLFEKYGVLSSRGIQKRYLEATTRRKDVEVIEEYILLSKAEIKKYSNIVIVNINLNSTTVDVNINPGSKEQMLTETPQSKVKESRVKDSRVKESSSTEKKEAAGDDSQLSKNVFVAWEALWMFPNLVQKEILIELSETYSDELVVAAIKIAGSKDVIKGRAINFIEAVLQEWEDNNVENIEQARKYQRNRNKQRKSYNNKPSVNKEPLPDWANKASDTSKDDELVEDNETENRLDRLRRLREEKGIENEIN